MEMRILVVRDARMTSVDSRHYDVVALCSRRRNSPKLCQRKRNRLGSFPTNGATCKRFVDAREKIFAEKQSEMLLLIITITFNVARCRLDHLLRSLLRPLGDRFPGGYLK